MLTDRSELKMLIKIQLGYQLKISTMKYIIIYCYFLFFISCNEKNNAVDNIKLIFDKSFERKLFESIEQSVYEQKRTFTKDVDSIYINSFVNSQQLLLNSFKHAKNYNNLRTEMLRAFVSDLSVEDTLGCKKIFIIEKRVRSEKITNSMIFLICKEENVFKKVYSHSLDSIKIIEIEMCKKIKPINLDQYFEKIQSAQVCNYKDYCNYDYYYISRIEQNKVLSKSIFYLCGSDVLKIE